MAKFLFSASYSMAGLQGTLKEGAAKRVKAIEKAVASYGGTVEAMYWSFGKADVIVIAELPDNVAAVAFSTTVAAAGVANVSTTVLLTAAEVDKARRMKGAYRPPGT